MSKHHVIDGTPLINAVSRLLREPGINPYEVGTLLWNAYPMLQSTITWHLERLKKTALFDLYLDALAQSTDDRVATDFETIRQTSLKDTLERLADSCCLIEQSDDTKVKWSLPLQLPNGPAQRVILSFEFLTKELPVQLGPNSQYHDYLLGQITTFSPDAEFHGICEHNGQWFYLQFPHPRNAGQISRCVHTHFRRLQLGPGQPRLINHFADARSFLRAVNGLTLVPNAALSPQQICQLQEVGFDD